MQDDNGDDDIVLGVISLRVDESVTTFTELEPHPTVTPVEIEYNDTEIFFNRTVEIDEVPVTIGRPGTIVTGEPVSQVCLS